MDIVGHYNSNMLHIEELSDWETELTDFSIDGNRSQVQYNQDSRKQQLSNWLLAMKGPWWITNLTGWTWIMQRDSEKAKSTEVTSHIFFPIARHMAQQACTTFV